jgi:CBS domain containing-hemolysin-like protein
MHLSDPRNPRGYLHVIPSLFVAFAVFTPAPAYASFLHGEALDTAADVMSWFVIIMIPAVGIVAFWLVHILPEKIAAKKRHPQTKAIQCLCLLSLFFGGLLWPIAWLWAYTKPVLHKLAYGTDVDDSHGKPTKEEAELETLRTRVAELESQLKPEGGQA